MTRYLFFALFLTVIPLSAMSQSDELSEKIYLSECLTYLDIEFSCEDYILMKAKLVDRTIAKDNYESKLRIDAFLIGEFDLNQDFGVERSLNITLRHWENGRENGTVTQHIVNMDWLLSYDRLSPGIFCFFGEKYVRESREFIHFSVRVDLAQAAIEARQESESLRLGFSEFGVVKYQSRNCS